MARGSEGKLRRRNDRKKAREQDGGENPFMAPIEDNDDDDDDRAAAAAEAEEENDTDSAVPSSKKKAIMTKRPPPPNQKPQGIKTTPLILLIIMLGTTLIPAFIYTGDFVSSYLAKNSVLGSIGFRLGIGASPKKRVLSFYEKHDPSKIGSVDSILSKHYGEYPKLIKKLERKYGDYGYFMGWEEDEAPMKLVLEQLHDTRDYLGEQFNIHAPQVVKTGVRNARYNIGTIQKKVRKIWKKTLWPLLEPIFGVPKGSATQKRKDAKEARARRAEATGRKKKNTEFRDDVEDEH